MWCGAAWSIRVYGKPQQRNVLPQISNAGSLGGPLASRTPTSSFNNDEGDDDSDDDANGSNNDNNDGDEDDPSYDLVSISLSPLLHPDFTGIGTLHYTELHCTTLHYTAHHCTKYCTLFKALHRGEGVWRRAKNKE